MIIDSAYGLFNINLDVNTNERLSNITRKHKLK